MSPVYSSPSRIYTQMNTYFDFLSFAAAASRSSFFTSAIARLCAWISSSWSSLNDNLRMMRQYSLSWGSRYRSISTNSSESQPHAATYSSGMASRVDTRLPAVFRSLGTADFSRNHTKSLGCGNYINGTRVLGAV